MNVTRTVEIQLNNGQIATIDLSDEIVERVRTTFCLNSQDQVTDSHIKYYLVSSMRRALEDTDV